MPVYTSNAHMQLPPPLFHQGSLTTTSCRCLPSSQAFQLPGRPAITCVSPVSQLYSLDVAHSLNNTPCCLSPGQPGVYPFELQPRRCAHLDIDELSVPQVYVTLLWGGRSLCLPASPCPWVRVEGTSDSWSGCHKDNPSERSPE